LTMGWWIASVLVWLISAACIISTMWEVTTGRKKLWDSENLGAYFFHGGTAILALWLVFKAMA
jgi:hypothetical protein